MTNLRTQPSSRRSGRRLALLAAAAGCLIGLSGCGSMFAALPGIGEAPETPARPATMPPTPSVFRSADQDKPMSAAERQKMEAELIAARERAAVQRREQISQSPSR
jgi:hypothetical protein